MFNMLHSILFEGFFASSAENKNILKIRCFISLTLIIFRYIMIVFYLIIAVQLYFLVKLVNFKM